MKIKVIASIMWVISASAFLSGILVLFGSGNLFRMYRVEIIPIIESIIFVGCAVIGGAFLISGVLVWTKTREEQDKGMVKPDRKTSHSS